MQTTKTDVCLPGKSTHEAIFKTNKHVYSSINNKTLMGMLLLDIAKAFNCMNHDLLFIECYIIGSALQVDFFYQSVTD